MKKAFSITMAALGLIGAGVSHAGSWTSAYIPDQVQTYSSINAPYNVGIVVLNSTLYACNLADAYCAEGIKLTKEAVATQKQVQLHIHTSTTLSVQLHGGSAGTVALIDAFSLND